MSHLVPIRGGSPDSDSQTKPLNCLKFALFAFALLIAIAFSLFACIRPAFAYSPRYVADLSKVDSGTVFLTNISNSNLTYRCSGNFAKMATPRAHADVGLTAVSDFYVKPTIAANTTLGSATSPCITAKWTKAGYTSSGKQVDLELVIQSITFPSYSITTTNNRMLLVYAGNLIGLGSGGPTLRQADGYGVNMLCKMSIYETGTSTLVKEKTQFAVKDLDIMGYGSSFANAYAESIELVSGFDNQTYVQSNTLLNKSTISSSSGSVYRGTANDNNTWRSGFAASFSNGTASFRYRACNYAATIILGTYTSYPTWNAPSKTVNNLSPSAVVSDCYNDTISFQHSQFVPYTATSNAASSIVFTDTLNAAFDMPFTTVKVFRNNTDNTSAWTISKSGNTITATAKAPASCNGQYKMIITTRLRPECDLSSYARNGSAYRIPNTSSTKINGVEKKSNTVYADVNPYAYLYGKVSPSNADFVAGNDRYALEGAKYSVYSDSSCTKLVASFATDADGNYSVAEKLPFGTYYLKQDSPSSGYRSDDTTYTVNVSFSSTTVDQRARKIKHDLILEPQSGFIEILQRHSADSDFLSTSGKYHLGGAVYLVSSSNPSWTVKTNDDGSSSRIAVPLGVSHISIQSAPEGYLRISDIDSGEKIDEVDISTDGQVCTIIRTNVPVKGKITLSFKNSSSSEIDLSGVRIGLFANEDIYDNEGNIVVEKDALVYDQTLVKGESTLTTDALYLGSYSARVLSVPEHLSYQGDEKDCVLSYAGETVPMVFADGEFSVSAKVEMPQTGTDGNWHLIVVAFTVLFTALSVVMIRKTKEPA